MDYTPITNPGNNRGNTKIKFDSDADYVYGYIEVPNTDNLYFKNASTMSSALASSASWPSDSTSTAWSQDRESAGR